MSIRRLSVKEMYRVQKECGGRTFDGNRKVITREDLEDQFPFVAQMGDFDELEFRYGLIRYRVRKF